MQLPRGTFREIRKNVAVESLLHALNGENFSGVVSISSPSHSGTLVFKAGKCILVKVQNLCGDAGLDEIQNAGSVEVDAILSLLDEAQISLALEFNKPCRILTVRKQTTVPSQPARPVSGEPARSVPFLKIPPLKSAGNPASTPPHVPAPQPQASPAPVHASPPRPLPFQRAPGPLPPVSQVPANQQDDGRKETGEPAENDLDTSSFESDFDTFDSMDFESVTDKIRTDCKTMIKQLHLDHLMER